MTLTGIEKDIDSKTMTMTAHFDASVDRVWEMFANPRLLERWWGPPTHPATFVDHDLRAGGRATYFMTGPEGDKYHGWWRVLSVDAPHGMEAEDGFGESPENPDADMPISGFEVSIGQDQGRSRLTILTTFPSKEEMERLTEMGMEEGLSAAVGQMDALLAEQ